MASATGSQVVARIVDLLLRAKWFWLLAGIAIAIAAYPAAQRMKFDRSIERMFAADDPVLPPYERLKAEFGGNEVVLAVYPDADLMHPDGRGIKRLAKISQQLKLSFEV